MITCSQCGEILPDIVDGHASEQAEALLAQSKDRERCQRCIDVYRKTASLCREALRKVVPATNVKDGEQLLSALREKLHNGG